MPTRILLVEDNPGDAVIFREKLLASDLDFELVHAKRLTEGLRIVGERPFDILLVDLSLPDAQGLDTVRRVREVAPERPLIVLTGLDDATMAAEAKKEGAVDYLVKWYVDSPSLARYIRYAIAQYKMFGGPPDKEGDGAAGEGPAPPAAVRGGGGSPPVVEPPPPVQAAPLPEPERAPAPAPRSSGGGDALRGALEATGTALVIIDSAAAICYANATARELLGRHGEPGARYPWPIELGVRAVRAGGTTYAQHVAETRWGEARAHFITLVPAPEPAEGAGAADHLSALAEAALGYVERMEQRSAWMADVLRAALEAYRQDAGGVALRPESLDLYDLAQQAVRKHRPIALRRGIPLRAESNRKKVMAVADRNVATALLNRLVTDATWAARDGAGVTLTVDVAGADSVVRAEWDPGNIETSSSASIAALGLAVVERQAERTRATFHHERQGGGPRVVTVTFPGREPAGA